MILQLKSLIATNSCLTVNYHRRLVLTTASLFACKSGQISQIVAIRPQYFGQQAVLKMPSSSSSESSSVPSYPRAAVAVTLQSISSSTTTNDDDEPSYLLVQRAKPPDQYKWSLPGGKIELGEETMVAAQRELTEETCINHADCKWNHQPFMTTDAIVFDHGNNDNNVAFHYVIAQCFAQIEGKPESLKPSDDALDAKWWTLDEIKTCPQEDISSGVVTVVERAEDLFQKGALF